VTSTPAALLTIGHSTRTFEELAELLHEHQVEVLFDVRTLPRSRRHPHFDRERLERSLPGEGIEYRHLAALGGLRKPVPESANQAWRNEGFRGFADHMQTQAFQAGLQEVLEVTSQRRVALMCAEAVPWRCHRMLISDALVARGTEVQHILGPKQARAHRLTPSAHVTGGRVTYPAHPGVFARDVERD
jgi:uncharacterized protein (DUF488 family)